MNRTEIALRKGPVCGAIVGIVLSAVLGCSGEPPSAKSTMDAPSRGGSSASVDGKSLTISSTFCQKFSDGRIWLTLFGSGLGEHTASITNSNAVQSLSMTSMDLPSGLVKVGFRNGSTAPSTRGWANVKRDGQTFKVTGEGIDLIVGVNELHNPTARLHSLEMTVACESFA